jgi:hypothetical protein
MSKTANFKVDPKLAILLGENYRSTELAIKELVDNSFDADSEKVVVKFPEPFSNDPIIVSDNGTGMTDNELRNEYLKVANSRFSRKGERTKLKNRLVKGRKGIGKFAGLMIADEMVVETISRGIKTTLSISRTSLSRADYDLEKIELPISSEKTAEKSGTTVTLNRLNDNLNFPNPDRLKELLILDYGREEDFSILVNDEFIDIKDIIGQTFTNEFNLPNAGNVQIRYTISDQKKSLKQSGIVLRVNGKIVGRPQLFGLEESEIIPVKLQKRLVGEIIANEIKEEDITSDWGAIIENSKALEDLKKAIVPQLEKSFEETYNAEVKFAKARLQKRVNAGLAKLPAFKRVFAKKALDKVMLKFFGESEDKIATVISVMLGAFEKDDYWVVIENIEKSADKNISALVEALSEFGLIDTALVAQQATNRLKLLDEFEKLILDENTLKDQIHKALKSNLWLLGNDYTLVSSNEMLKGVINNYLDKKYKGDNSGKRPNLMLFSGYNNRYILIELKRLNHDLGRKSEAQALEHRDELKIYFPNNKIEILVIGNGLKKGIKQENLNIDVNFVSYRQLISAARNQINWIISQSKA